MVNVLYLWALRLTLAETKLTSEESLPQSMFRKDFILDIWFNKNYFNTNIFTSAPMVQPCHIDMQMCIELVINTTKNQVDQLKVYENNNNSKNNTTNSGEFAK